ncbi:MAG: mechanosensitive ion channel family protein, partial [Desulfobacula sp.]|nr:mechanosensitive ion channel family protein [Desulfobacula sp.]
MNLSKEQLLEYLVQIAPNRYLQACLIIILFLCLAKIIDVIITRVIAKWIKFTKLKLDDQVLDIFHRPVFVSIILFGFALATERLNFKDTVSFLTLGGLQTIAIFLWAYAALRFFKLLLNYFSNDKHRFNIIQDRTLPLFQNLFMIIITGLAIYIMFLVWNIDLTAWVASAGILGLAISFA